MLQLNSKNIPYQSVQVFLSLVSKFSVIATFPILNYLSLSLRFSEVNQEVQMRQYGQEIANTIYHVSPMQKIFLFPRSIIYKAALLDNNNQNIFSLISEDLPYFSNDEYSKNGTTLFYKHTLLPNLLNAKFLIVQKELSYSQVIFDILIIIGVVLVGIFMISYLIIKSLLKPYIETSSRMNNFFDDVMHELKTPLGIMQLNIEGLVLKYKDKRLNRSLAALSTLSTLYDDLEYLIKNKTITYTTECVDFSTFLEDRISYFEALSVAKEIELVVTIQKDISITINRVELQRVIDNNLTNAIKYSYPKHKIYISLSKENHNIFFKVQDEGVGIKELDKIFIRHYRGDIFKGGFGIGLSIVKSICEKYNIKIEVLSKEKEGSEFLYIFESR